MEPKELLDLLEERLIQHDESRKEVQRKLQGVCTKIVEDADALEEMICGEAQKGFDETENRIAKIAEELNEGGGGPDSFVKQADKELSTKLKYQLKHFEGAKTFSDSYKLKISSVPVTKRKKYDDEEEGMNKVEWTTKQLQEHLSRIRESMAAAQEKIVEACTKRRSEAKELEKRVNEKLELVFSQEDARTQESVKRLRESIGKGRNEEQEELMKRGRNILLVNQKYDLTDSPGSPGINGPGFCVLKVVKEANLKYIDFESRRPRDLTATLVEKCEMSASFSFFSEEEKEILKPLNLGLNALIEVWEKDKEGEKDPVRFTDKYILGDTKPIVVDWMFPSSTTYSMKVKIEGEGASSQWSEEGAEFTTPDFTDCSWRKCPGHIDEGKVYSVNEDNGKVATFKGYTDFSSTIIGSVPLPLGKITTWSIKLLRCWMNGKYAYVGVTPFDINQNEYDNTNGCGWYFRCYDSTLWSGPPHDYCENVYGPKREDEKYVDEGDSVGVVMDTAKGELSFVLNGVNLGVAYEGIPLDKPLVPCVILGSAGDSVELVV